jgi:iron complex outermembrane receptor protein
MASVSGAALAVSVPAFAQGAEEAAAGEIVVTARKREETALQVPVSVTALSGAQLQNYAVTNVDQMARSVPSLIVGEGGGTVQGGIIAIRGLSGADNNPLNDQAVSFNIDGVAVGRATVRRMGDFDTAQVEVLKGPQALFFGKNSPAGIIVMKSADPTETFEAKVSSGYEFKAKEWRSDAYVSGPLSDSLGFRVAGFYSDMSGWAKNIVGSQVNAALPFIVDPGHRAPNKKDFAVRGTLKFDDGGPFNAKLKLSYGKVKGDSSSFNTQFVNCPLGVPQVQVGQASGYIDNCKADGVNQVGGFNEAALAALFPSKKDWNKGLFQEQYQFLGGLEMNLDVSDKLTLSSQTGYYRQNLDNIGNFTQAYYNTGAGYNLDANGNVTTDIRVPAAVSPTGRDIIHGAGVRRWDLVSYNELELKEFSQELRLTSKLDGPFNFMVGGLITSTNGGNGSLTAGGSFLPAGIVSAAGPAPINHYWYQVKGKSQSVFGQLIVNPVDVIEIAAGARASWEQKKLPRVETGVNAGAVLAGGLTDVGAVYGLTDIDRKVSFHDVSPEFTISYKPNQDLNVYGGYKEGFLSGGFAAVVPNIATFRDGVHIYKPQVTKGFEGGIKAALLDRALRVNLAYYNYKTSGLQVGLTVGGVNPVLLNAANARTQGVDFDFTYKTPVEGLTLNGAINYNKGKYLDFTAPCYGGQASEQCFFQPNSVSGVSGFFQNLDGKQMARAPKVTANVGFNYESLIGGMKLGLSGNMTHSDSYFTDTANTPGGKQSKYNLLDASVRLGAEDDTWQIAFIGRNLTNKYYIVRSSDSPFSGSGNTGTYAANSPYRLLADTAASVSRGRELWVRLSYKFGAK